MGAWLLTAWGQIWPNLVASAIWAPAAFVTHHLLVRRHLRRIHAALNEKRDEA